MGKVVSRTAIEAEILFAAHIIHLRFLKRLSGKTPLEQNSSGKKIGAESAVLHFVFFEVIVNKMQQSAKESCSLKRNTVPEVFPLTIGSGKTKPFEKRRSRYKETAENKAEAYRVYVEHLFSACDAVDARMFSKGDRTGVKYYGARYLDPKYSKWLSADSALSYYVDGKSNGSSGGIYNPINFNFYHYADNNPIRYIDPTGLEEDVSEAERQLKELRQLGEEMFYKGTINGVNLYTENYEDGCYARATVIAGELEKLGFGVTDYSYVTSPVMPGVIKAEKAAKRDPSKVPDKDSEGNSNRYRFHVAATVIIDGKKYVVDPYYHKSWLSISEQEDWYSCQYSRGTSTQPAYDKSGNLIGPSAMTSWKTRSSYTGTLSINEYAQGWLKNYDSVKRDNEKNKKNNNPYIWSGK